MSYMYIIFFLVMYQLKIIVCSNLALTFDAENSKCTASCAACPEETRAGDQLQDSNQEVPQIFETTQKNAETIQDLQQQVKKIDSTLSHLRNTTVTNSGTTQKNAETVREVQQQVDKIDNTLSHLRNTTINNSGTAQKNAETIREVQQHVNKIDSTLLHLKNTTITNSGTTQKNAETIQEVQQQVNKIDSTLSYLKNTTITNSGAISDILLLVEELIKKTNTSSTESDVLPTSCQQIKKRMPNSPSGVYLIANEKVTNDHKYVYCHMEELCGSDEGWTRLAYLNMSDSSAECPSGFRLYESGGVRACGRPVSSRGSCASVKFPSNGTTYSEVCGRVVGYRYNTLDYPGSSSYGINIDSYYLDGISLTHGSPRKHIWSFIRENNNQSPYIQSFIGNDYFCENTPHSPPLFYTADPLWDGKDCDQEPTCCNREGLPWFHKVMTTTTSDYIELRVCCDQDTNDEDVPFGLYELFVKK